MNIEYAVIFKRGEQYVQDKLIDLLSSTVSMSKKAGDIVKKNKFKTVLLLGIACAIYEYTVFPDTVYQTTRIDRQLDQNNPDEKDLVDMYGTTMYGIEDAEQYGTNFVMNMLSGFGEPDQWKEYMASLGVIINNTDTIPSDMQNRALYIALWETHNRSFSPKIRITPISGDFKHLSAGRGAYTDHFNHIVYSYFLLRKKVIGSDQRNLSDITSSVSYSHRENLQTQLISDIISECSHTYALGEYKYDYVNKFLSEGLKSAEIVQDSSPRKTFRTYTSKENIVIYQEWSHDTLRIIKKHLFHTKEVEQKVIKSGFVHVYGDVYCSFSAYSKSYDQGFEGRIHGIKNDTTHAFSIQQNILVPFFVATYEKEMDRYNEREIFDFARILIGDFGIGVIDNNRGIALMKYLDDSGYVPAQKYINNTFPQKKQIKKNAVPDLFAPDEPLVRMLKQTRRELMGGKEIVVEEYDEK